MTDASAAHPVYDRTFDHMDLLRMPIDAVVVDAWGVRWTKIAEGGGGRWVSILETTPGVESHTLIELAGPIRRDRRQSPNQEVT